MADSVFRNLNYGRVEHSLGSLDRTENLYSNSQGIVATINDFKGSVEFRNNSITHNMVFIPSAILSNNQKLNNFVVNLEMSYFKTKAPSNDQEGHR